MTDNTDVDPDELRTFANGTDDRAEHILSAADHVRDLRPGTDTFGQLNAWFLDEVRDAASRTATGLMLLGKTLRAEATTIRDAATTYDNTEQNQVHRFGGEPRG